MKKNGLHRNRHPTIRERIKAAIGRIGTLNLVLIFVGIYVVYINNQMITVYRLNGSAPETAWCALIAALLGECGICGWIKTSKEKHKTNQESKIQSEEDFTWERLEDDEDEI